MQDLVCGPVALFTTGGGRTDLLFELWQYLLLVAQLLSFMLPFSFEFELSFLIYMYNIYMFCVCFAFGVYMCRIFSYNSYQPKLIVSSVYAPATCLSFFYCQFPQVVPLLLSRAFLGVHSSMSGRAPACAMFFA